MLRTLAKIQLQLYKITNRIQFFIFYPYLKPSVILGFKFAKLPRLFLAGKGLKLIITNGKVGGKNIVVSPGSWLGDDVELNTFRSCRIEIKRGASIQDRCKLIGNVIIHRNVIMAPNVFISSGTHQAFLRPHRTIREQDLFPESQDYASKQINIIEEDCWIGINVFIKPGVYVGRGSVIGANTSVLKDIPPYSVIVGHSKVVRARLNFSPDIMLETSNELHIPYFYRGFDFAKGFWENDNLTLFSNCNPMKLKIVYDLNQSFSVIKFQSNTGHEVILKLANGSTEAISSFSRCQNINVPEIIRGYFCLKMMSLEGPAPRIKKIEVYPE